MSEQAESDSERIVKGFNRYGGEDRLFVSLLRERGLNTEQIAAVITTLGEVCHSCYDNEPDCQCWNDE